MSGQATQDPIGDRGIEGNGQTRMPEQNGDAPAAPIVAWIEAP